MVSLKILYINPIIFPGNWRGTPTTIIHGCHLQRNICSICKKNDETHNHLFNFLNRSLNSQIRLPEAKTAATFNGGRKQ